MSKPPEAPRKALGRGLSALLASRPAPVELHPPTAGSGAAPAPERPTHLSAVMIDPNPLQPRRVFQQDRLEDLAQSIRTNGIVQPIVVRKAGDRYQLVAGERRWRAAQMAGLDKLPVVIQDIPDDRLLEVTLIENIQREDLNPIETALAFERLAKELDLSHEEVGQRTGKDRTTITNLLRLLHLPPDVQQLVADRKLSQGHARCLLGLPPDTQREIAEKAVAHGMSVRQLEHLTQRLVESRKQTKPAKAVVIDPNVKAAIDELERALGTRVRIISQSARKGRIEIEYYSPDDLDRLYTLIVKNSE